jgi:hypothetical protein
MKDILTVLNKINKKEYKRRKMNMMHTDVPKRQRNGINARLKGMVDKYGFKEVRLVTNNFFKGIIEKDKLEKQIAEKEKELQRLKRNK